ncbi:TPA: DUF3289 family protein [Yersinia enterocolitica]
MRFGEDLLFGVNGSLPTGFNRPAMACTEIMVQVPGSVLQGIPPSQHPRSCEPHWSPPVAANDQKRDEKNMRRWIEDLRLTFSENDSRGLTRHAFDEMFGPINNPRSRDAIKLYSTRNLNAAANAHENINDFCDLVLNAPPNNSSRTRVHQALKNAGWDINNIQRISDLGLPAFNRYSFLGVEGWGLNPFWPTEDAANGLTLLIHDIANAAVVATNYCYCEQSNKYDIDLLFLFYDLFGIDTPDVHEFGGRNLDSARGIKAWYSLQREKGYAPHITRFAIHRSYRGIDTV